LTIQEGIERLGDSFRGLWKSRTICENGDLGFDRWTVTFIYRGHYVETPDFCLPDHALEWAVEKLREHGERFRYGPELETRSSGG
jgi:hypothetical protein